MKKKQEEETQAGKKQDIIITITNTDTNVGIVQGARCDSVDMLTKALHLTAVKFAAMDGLKAPEETAKGAAAGGAEVE
jgi:hypothetical protein